ncbi:glycoside hydrolase family 88/105 protein [Algibacter pacificus]|uniref:glycoside hydrolase family 88/105 protein n=1 Tax=Algibacter pacificus TaxID=2599389 RepID=UPI0011CBF59D|nr:glycoside hydrolase family 88 protein [Algibacter pacificus]
MKRTYLKTLVSFGILAMTSCNLISQSSNIEDKMVKALEWQEQHPIFAISPTDWTNGAYYTGVVRAHQSTKNQVFLAALKTMGYNNQWGTLKRYHHADDIAIVYPYLYINSTRKNLVDMEPSSTFINKHLFDASPWKQGPKDSLTHILWWWCDALFMAPPVLASYSKYKKDLTFLDEMHKYYMETYNLLYDKEAHLFARDLRYVWKGTKKDMKADNGEKIFWSRGNGWVLGGLSLVLEDMPKDYKHRAFYENLFKEMAYKLKSIQSEDGLWRTSLLDPDAYNHGETSGSGFFTFALAWGINNNLLPKQEFKSVVEKAWKALENSQQENGMVGWVQNIGDAPTGAGAKSWQNYGTGAFLMAGSEVLKLK